MKLKLHKRLETFCTLVRVHSSTCQKNTTTTIRFKMHLNVVLKLTLDPFEFDSVEDDPYKIELKRRQIDCEHK